MSVTVDLTPEEITKLRRFTALDTDEGAVAKAAREFLRIAQLRELKAASGKVDYEPLGEAMEALELRERSSTE